MKTLEQFQHALAQFKKASKERRVRMAALNNKPDVDAYRKWLEAGVKRLAKKATTTPTSSKSVVVKQPKASKKATKAVQLTDMVIAFDSTGSMATYINSVKQHVTELIKKLFAENPNLMISIVVFGDYCDMAGFGHADSYGKAYQVIGLTNDVQKLTTFVQFAENTSGDDSDEFYEVVIQKVTWETQWREGATRNVLLIGDANPHPAGTYRWAGRTVQTPDWREEARKASSLGVVFDTLKIVNSSKWYEELSQITGGVCLPFNNSQKTGQLLYATATARGGDNTRNTFLRAAASAEVKADPVMNTVYSMYKEAIE